MPRFDAKRGTAPRSECAGCSKHRERVRLQLERMAMSDTEVRRAVMVTEEDAKLLDRVIAVGRAAEVFEAETVRRLMELRARFEGAR